VTKSKSLYCQPAGSGGSAGGVGVDSIWWGRAGMGGGRRGDGGRGGQGVERGEKEWELKWEAPLTRRRRWGAHIMRRVCAVLLGTPHNIHAKTSIACSATASAPSLALEMETKAKGSRRGRRRSSLASFASCCVRCLCNDALFGAFLLARCYQ
jgi:hypothetical protein